MAVKDGHMEHLQKLAIRPAAKVPYGLEKEYDAALDELYKTLVPIDGQDLICASQIVPVTEIKNGKKILK